MSRDAVMFMLYTLALIALFLILTGAGSGAGGGAAASLLNNAGAQTSALIRRLQGRGGS